MLIPTRGELVDLNEFLRSHESEILASCEAKTLELSGTHSLSDELMPGLPIFFKQLISVLEDAPAEPDESAIDRPGMARAANASDEPGIARAAGRPFEAEMARTAGIHGDELQKRGYTLSHVVHAYGSMCQAITELAIENQAAITPTEFRKLNRCLDVAIAGAVTTFQARHIRVDSSREIEHLGFLAHELRNALTTVNVSLRLIKNGVVGFGGSTGQVLDRGLKHIQELVDRSLTEVRLRVDPKVHPEPAFLLQLLDQIAVTAEVEAQAKNQKLEIRIDPSLVIEADPYLLYSALSNIIQNAIKYTHTGGVIQVRGSLQGDQAIIEIEDQCGGLRSAEPSDLFKAFEQHNRDRDGIGLGLTIAHRAITLNHGTIDVENFPGRGCMFRVTLPNASSRTTIEPIATSPPPNHTRNSMGANGAKH
ncbi:MAG: HAMP domain-containing sensor histidine kinase [Pseudomonadota bacterium]